MKTKEAPCTSYVSEGNTCLMGYVAHHYGNCQHCKHYQARKGFRIFKKDNKETFNYRNQKDYDKYDY